ncbi:MAG: type II secretion system F family protein [Candidatus Nanohaloarchaea archaeon]|nr:type II secretion system F family protein [Candidatus Nanohaloarchaea archaeon]
MSLDMERLQELVYHALPGFYRDRMEQKALYARIPNHKSLTFNIYIVFSVILAIFLLIFQASLLFKAAVTVIAVPIIINLPYLVFSLLANKRRKEIEQVLPDALHLVSANIKSGLTIEKAFLLAARDEFGPLANDLKHAAMSMFGGEPIDEALEGLADRTNSELFAETLNLLRDGIESGGNVSDLLESSAADVQKTLHLREEIAANVQMYSIFILMASLFGAPVLFSVSVFLTRSTASLWSSQSVNFENLPSTGILTMQQPSFRPEFFADFALAAIIISNLFAALIISEIKNGNVKEGLKLIPVFVVVAVIIFFLTSSIITLAFGGFVQ